MALTLLATAIATGQKRHGASFGAKAMLKAAPAAACEIIEAISKEFYKTAYQTHLGLIPHQKVK